MILRHGAAARRDHGAHFVVEANQADAVALTEQEPRDGCRHLLGVRELGEPPRRTAPGHGLADIQDDGGFEIRFFLELLDEPLVGAGDDFPIEKAQVVAGLVGAVLGKLD